MTEKQARGMEEVILKFVLLGEGVDLGSIDRIPDDRMSDQLAMYSQLMRAACQRLQFEQSMSSQSPPHPVMCLRAPSLAHDAPVRPGLRVITDRGLDLALILFNRS